MTEIVFDVEGNRRRALEARRRQQRFMEETQPYFELKAKILAVQPVSHTFCPDEVRMDSRIDYMPGAEETLRKIDEMISDIGLRIFKEKS